MATTMRLLMLAGLLFLASCATGRPTPSAVMQVEFQSITDMERAATLLGGKLESMGFVSHGETAPPDEILLRDKESGAAHFSIRRFSLSRFFPQTKAVELYATLSLHPRAESDHPRSEPGHVLPPKYPLLRISLAAMGPSEFSPAAEQVLGDLIAAARGIGGQVVVVNEPPQPDPDSYRMWELTSYVALAFLSLTVWLIGLTVFGSLSHIVVRRLLPNSIAWRRVAFVAVGVLAATPIPIVMWPLGGYVPVPNLFVLPDNGWNYRHLTETNPVILPTVFIASFAMSVILSFWLIGRRANVKQEKAAE